MRKLKYFFFFAVALIVIISSLSTNKLAVYALDTNNYVSSAKAMCVIERDSGKVITSINKNMKLPMASTTKILTAITAIENCHNLDETIKVSNSAVGIEGSSIYLRNDELISVRDLLFGLMLRSGNDSAVAIAYHVGGNIAGFANLMNETAKKAGATNSNFVNPHGLDHSEHYTTAYDLAKITAYALKNKTFKEIVSCKQHTVAKTNKSDKRYMTNKNRLLNSLDGCIGVKTGYTKKAGRCLVSATERGNESFVCVVLNCGPMFEDSARLLDLAHRLYENKKIIDKNQEIYNEYIINDKQGKLYLYAEEDFYYPLLDSEKDKISIRYSVKLKDAKAGDVVGEIKVFFENDLLKTIKLVTMNKIDKLIESETLEISEILWEDKGNEN